MCFITTDTRQRKPSRKALAAAQGKTQWVKGYTRRDGKRIAGYWRKHAVKREWIGTVTMPRWEQAIVVG